MAERRKSRRGEGGRKPVSFPPPVGGALMPLSEGDVERIVEPALKILAETGLSESDGAIEAVLLPKGAEKRGDRLCLPRAMVKEALDGLPRALTLYGRDGGADVELSGTRVQMGTGGAAPMVVDLEDDRYRPSTLADLFQAAVLAERLGHIDFFSRPVVARDMETAELLAINTAYAALAGTRKHVLAAAEHPGEVDAIARLCGMVAGGDDQFRARPFLSLNINHVVPPLRFEPGAMAVLAAAVRAGIPAHVNVFGQLGASSPVTIAGCLAQSLAEALAGMVFGFAIDPAAKLIFGMRPMITDLRTGGMAGGAGEQALLTAASVQLARHLGLPNSTIAGASDAKLPDTQSGYEKAINVAMAAHGGCNMVTQAAGMQAGLMGLSFEAMVADNEMLGAIKRSLSGIEVSDDTLALGSIDAVVQGEGHFLGQPETLARMESDFLYPEIASRDDPEAWAAAGAPEFRARAKARARELLRAPEVLIPDEIDRAIRASFDIRLERP